MKEKESVAVITRDFKLNPQCRHGPTVLFSRKNGEKKFFACSATRYERSHSCFYLEYDQFERNKAEILGSKVNYERHSIADLRQLPADERIFCGTCKIFISTIQSHEFHSYRRMDDMQQPSLFLPQLDNDKANAQYFFDDLTLQFFAEIFKDLRLSKIVCLGAPRLHDYVRNQSGGRVKSILLDLDQRFEAFYPGEFVHFNMLNSFFFNPSDEAKLMKFLQDNEDDDNSHHCIFTDPPFAARTELLSYTLREISNRYFAICRKRMPIFFIYPYFNENHLRKEMPEMEMLDYQVTYMNHYAFNENYKGRKEGSPIRVFTNIDQRIIKYPALTNYRYCTMCHRFVAQNNLHCKICKRCPSKNGATYRHCNDCIKCVKPTYVHCSECDRCVQRAGHECKTYQAHQECWCCHERGHVEKFCRVMKRFKQPKKNGTCRICKGHKRHNLSVCPSKARFL